jgi:hypothetical protein
MVSNPSWFLGRRSAFFSYFGPHAVKPKENRSKYWFFFGFRIHFGPHKNISGPQVGRPCSNITKSSKLKVLQFRGYQNIFFSFRINGFSVSKFKWNKQFTGVYRFWLCITFGESESKKWKVLRFPDQNLKTGYSCEKFKNKKLGAEKFSWVNWEISLFSHFSLALPLFNLVLI